MASLQLPNCKKNSAAHKNGFKVLVVIWYEPILNIRPPCTSHYSTWCEIIPLWNLPNHFLVFSWSQQSDCTPKSVLTEIDAILLQWSLYKSCQWNIAKVFTISGKGPYLQLSTVSLSLLHSHTCYIYEANMRHIWDKYAAFMMHISIIFSKNEVLSTTIF